MFARTLMLAAPSALLLSGTSVFALTADQVWADLQAFAAENGGQITAATEVADDGVITLNGVSVGPAGGPATLTIAELSIEEQDDGAVAFFPTDIKLNGAPGMTGSVNHEALSVTVFEDEAGLGYQVFADVLGVEFDMNSGTAEAPESNSGRFTFTGLEATYGRATDAMTLDVVATELSYDLTQVSASQMLDSTTTSTSNDLSLEGALTVPEGVDLAALDAPGAFEEALAKGLSLEASMTSGASKGTVEDRNAMMPMAAAFEGSGSALSMVANSTELLFDAAAEGMTLQVTPGGMPMPFPASMDRIAMTFQVPVSAPEGGNYQLKLALANLVLDESIWAMFDPGSALPREPADLALDLSGEVKMDLPATMAAEDAGAEPPLPEPLSLNITELGLKLAGAALTGTGAFTFDNSMVPMGGPPMPLGAANLRLEGGNKLIDGLIATGMLTEEDAMGARMMMAMFGKPEGDDVLTSQIEAKEGGSIFVNGQQIQ